MSARDPRQPLYATIWRWHFYAGLLVVPFVLLLAMTGAAYLFKPQVERWEERAFQGLPTTHAVTAQAQVAAALTAFPGARFASYRLPERHGDAAMIHLDPRDGRTPRDVFVSPQGAVLGSIPPGARLMEWAKRIHGQLLLGKRGSWIVELAASWALVLLLSGLYLWWPRGRGLAGVVWPRFGGGRRLFWRDLHAVTGFWVSGLALVLLVTALPWAGVWGSAFKAARTEMGWVKGPQDWTLGGEAPAPGGDAHAGHAAHGGAAMARSMSMTATGAPQAGLDMIVAKAEAEHLAFPVIVTPPGAPGSLGATGVMTWTVRSDAQNRPLRTSITYDPATGREIGRDGFADDHVIDRVVGYGIAWHEGQLFGWMNQLIGVLTAIGLIVMAVSGFVLWRRRRPAGMLGAPPPARAPARIGGVVAILLLLAAMLPLLAISLMALCLFEWLVLPHLPQAAQWLGVPSRNSAAG
jgi:uncharacterized iron-regulated membrane protein